MEMMPGCLISILPFGCLNQGIFGHNLIWHALILLLLNRYYDFNCDLYKLITTIFSFVYLNIFCLVDCGFPWKIFFCRCVCIHSSLYSFILIIFVKPLEQTFKLRNLIFAACALLCIDFSR